MTRRRSLLLFSRLLGGFSLTGLMAASAQEVPKKAPAPPMPQPPAADSSRFPKPDPRNPTFNAARAFADLEKQCAFGPRVPGKKGWVACRDWLVAELKSICGNATRQDWKENVPKVGEAPAVTIELTNIAARINPDAKTQVFLCAHWDTRPTADQEDDEDKRKQPIPGANDGASGVAVLLELARLFMAKKPTVGVQIVLFDGEDFGPTDMRMYLGARYYAKHPAYPRPDYAILLDMIGDKDLEIPREQYSEEAAKSINDKVWKAAAELGIKQFVNRVGHIWEGQVVPITDDHLPLQEAGWKAIDLIDFTYPDWHKTTDTPDKCSGASLKAVGDVIAKVVYDEK